ncbi:MAG: hypothetical protein WA160_02360 [Pseudobdellovibrio sp.]
MKFLNKSIYAILILASFVVVNSTAQAVQYLPISRTIFANRQLPFEPHQGSGPFDTTLAMNIQYEPVKIIRENLVQALKVNLHFFDGWEKNGEAHVTVITPPEYSNVIKKFVSIERMEQIAADMGIQDSDISILGIGKGAVSINSKAEETYFLIVQSRNLLRIRRQIYREYLANGGPENAWDPNHFFPHITVGFSLRDLHESDGVIKDVSHSLDRRFKLFLTN